MSRENVEKVYQAAAALKRRDIEELVGYFDPDVEVRSTRAELEGALYGHAGGSRLGGGPAGCLSDWNPIIREVRDLGDWTLVHALGGGTGVGVDVNQDQWMAVQFRSGLVLRYLIFRSEAGALEAVGLSE